MKKLFLYLLIAVLIFIGYLLFNTYNFTSTQIEVDPIPIAKIPDGAAQRFAEAISIRTISFEDESEFDSIQFNLFNDFLSNNYPLAHSKLDHKLFNDFSHLFYWQGKDETIKPIVLMAHIDVVPIANLPAWSVHPFNAGIINDTIYGRGALDCKFSLIAIMEVIEQLLGENFQPNRSIYISFGHDEEVSGTRGAIPIANYLKEKGVEAEFILDEGMALTRDLLDGLDGQIGMIGIAEKGYLSLELSVAMKGGHSSTPSKETSIDVLSKAISKLKENPSKRDLNTVFNTFLDKLGPMMDFKSRFIFANRHIFKSILLDILEKADSSNAALRTTTAPTIFEAGIKENVIPTQARAVVNFRIIPGETIEDVIAHAKNTIHDDRITIEVINKGSNPSSVSPTDNKQYHTIEKTIKQVFPNTMTTPYLVLGATDSRHFSEISNNIYRFCPYVVTLQNLFCYHGIDERVPKLEFENGIKFYRQLIINGSTN